VNHEVPYVYGTKEAFINVTDVDYICEQDHKLPELPSIPLTDMEKTIAHNIVPYIETVPPSRSVLAAWAMPLVSIWKIIKTWAFTPKCLLIPWFLWRKRALLTAAKKPCIRVK